ncbi:hypothetical protein F5B20DRAFT_584741 [Whalleya microplaca]|nr:hypothetical protein F5B20DRAFT_584741 [Whalleya microplaca]
MQKIDGKELLALLRVLYDPSASRTSQMRNGQIFFGLRTPADFLVQGQTPPTLLAGPLFAPFRHIIGETTHQQRAGSDAMGKIDCSAAFRQALAPKLARSMSISPDSVELNKPPSSYGVDSQVAIELRN